MDENNDEKNLLETKTESPTSQLTPENKELVSPSPVETSPESPELNNPAPQPSSPEVPAVVSQTSPVASSATSPETLVTVPEEKTSPASDVENNNQTIEKSSKKKKLLILTIILIFLVVAVTLVSLLRKEGKVDTERTKTLSEIKDEKILNFRVGEKDYKIGDKAEDLMKDFNVVKAFSQIDADNIMATPFSRGDEADFLGLLYCPSENPCSYEESKLIKANFYNRPDILIDGKIKFTSLFGDIKNDYGEPDGKYYQDETLSVWSFGKNVGDAYLVMGFDDGGLFSMGFANRIMLGVWWYEGEYEDTIIKGDDSGKENNN